MAIEPLVVSLVGRMLPDNENLSIGYLRAALGRAGFESRQHVLNDPAQLAGVADEIVRAGSRIVGLSLPDGGSAYVLLALGEMLSRRGFDGHVTCGGPFATLARDWLLERYDWLGSVVRHAGEVPLVHLARRIAHGRGLEGVPGLTTREGEGAPAPVLDPIHVENVALRGDLPVAAGHPVANIATSRGCRGRCAYCGPAALQESELREGLAGGTPRGELRRCGVGGVRRRSVGHLCDEMAELWHERGVRYFNLVDEHPLPWDEDEALEFLDAWKRGLDERGVRELGIGTMMRGDRITPRVARAFVETGLVRAFVGVELASRPEARLYSRPFMAEHAQEILALLGSLGVATVSNLMLLHPDSTPETIRAGIAMLDRIPCPVETTRMQVYHGTRLHERLAAEGRMTGNPLRWGYGFDDPRMQRFDEIFTRLRVEAFGDHSVAYSSHDLWLALALEARLGGVRRRSEAERLRDLDDRLRDLQVSCLADAILVAEHGGGFWESSGLVQRTRERAIALRREMTEIGDRLENDHDGRSVFSHVRAAAATALRVVMAGVPLAGCWSTHITGDADGGTDVAVEDVAAEEVLPDCTSEQLLAVEEQVREIAAEADPCFTGRVEWGEVPITVVDMGLYPIYCDTGENVARLEERRARVEEAFAGLDLRPDCVYPPYWSGTWVGGGDHEDLNRMMEAFWDSECPDLSGDCWALSGLTVVVDDGGRVVSVEERDGWCEASAEYIDCVFAVLEDLVFPCLAGFYICPEPELLD